MHREKKTFTQTALIKKKKEAGSMKTSITPRASPGGIMKTSITPRASPGGSMKTSITPRASPAATSRDLLSITGDGSSRSVVESLLKRPPKGSLTNKPKTFQVARSPLLGQIQAFLPELRKSTQELLSQPQDKIQGMDIENTDDDGKVVEMNILIEEMACESDESDEQPLHSSSQHESSSDSDSASSASSVLGPVTLTNIKIPSEAKGGRKRMKHRIQIVPDVHDEDEVSQRSKMLDIKLREKCTSSGER